jgi:hypothetical protein
VVTYQESRVRGIANGFSFHEDFASTAAPPCDDDDDDGTTATTATMAGSS